MRFTLLLCLLPLSFTIPAHAEQMRSLDYKNVAPPPALFNTPQEAQKEPSEKVWERYKALAAGQAQTEEKAAPPVEAKEPPAKPSGFSHLLKEYQANKKSRAGMRSIDVK